MSPLAAELWDRLIPQLDDAGILSPVHGPSLEGLCEWYALWRQAQADLAARGLLIEDPVQPWAVKRARQADLPEVTPPPARMRVNPAERIASRAAAAYMLAATKFGLTPADLKRVADAPPPVSGVGEGDPFD